MRVGQDLCIALVLAVVGVGFGKPSLTRPAAEEGLAIVESAMAESDLSDEEIASVRKLIVRAQELERAGDEDGVAATIASASAILKLS
jgi:hypothetical protein